LVEQQMATVPKTAAALPSTNVATARLGPPTRVASGQSGVEQLQSSAGVHFDAAAFGFREEDRPSFDRGAGRGGHQHHSGIVNAPTQAFAAMLEAATPVSSSDAGSADVRAGQFPGLVANAIRTYETNAAIISGEANVLGTSVSVVL